MITRKNFPAHIDNVHTSKSKCELCGKLVNQSTLPLHMRSIHAKEKWKCDLCGKELALYSLKNHKYKCRLKSKTVEKKTDVEGMSGREVEETLKNQSERIYTKNQKIFFIADLIINVD